MITRASIEKEDPGYRAYCISQGDKKSLHVFLDGIEQKHCITADVSEGWVKRIVETPDGNLAHNGGEVLHEVVRGVVTIEERPRTW